MTQENLNIDIKLRSQGMEVLDKLLTQMEQAGLETGEFRQQAETLDKELKKLAQQQKLINQFKQQESAVKRASNAYQRAHQRAKNLAQEMNRLGVPTKKQQAEFTAANNAVNKARAAYIGATTELHKMRSGMGQANIDSNNLTAAQTRIRAAVVRTNKAMRNLSTSANKAAGGLNNISKTRAGIQSISTQLGTLRNHAVGLMGLNVGTHMLRDVEETADAYKNLRARMSLVTGEGAALEDAYKRVREVALSTHMPLEDTGVLMTRIAQAGKSAGLSAKESVDQALSLTETINQAIQVSGATTQAADAAITQLIQGLQSGMLRGEEFNSVMEQSPRLAQAMADGLSVNTGELRRMAMEGKLTTDVVIKAIKSQSKVVQEEFGKLPPTVGRAITNLNSKWTDFIGNLDGSSGATANVAAGINMIADNLDEIAAMATRAGLMLTAGLAIQGVAALRAFALQTNITTASVALLRTNLNAIPKHINIAIAVVGFEVGWQIGKMLHENSELARKLGVRLAEYFTGLAHDLILVKDVATAIFTDKTIEDAFDSYQKRMKEMREIYGDMYIEAEKAPQKIGAAATQAAQSVDALGKTGQQTGENIKQGAATSSTALQETQKKAEDAASALKQLAAASNIPIADGVEGVQVLNWVIGRTVQKSQAAAVAIGKNLPAAIANLNGAQLAQFRDSFVQIMGEGKQNAELLQKGLEAIGLQAAKSLGVDVVQATNQMSAEFTQADANLQVLTDSFDGLQARGVPAANLVSAAIAKMLEQAKSQHEIAQLTKRIEGLRDKLGQRVTDGFLDQATQKLKQIGDASDDAKGGINSVREAMRKLGVTSKAELQQTAKEATEAYNVIKNSGQATSQELAKAWRTQADAQIAANDGVATATLKAQAKMHDLAIEADSTGKAVVRSMAQAAGAVGQVGSAAQSAKRAVDDLHRGSSGAKYAIIGDDDADEDKEKSTFVTASGAHSRSRRADTPEARRKTATEPAPRIKAPNWTTSNHKATELTPESKPLTAKEQTTNRTYKIKLGGAGTLFTDAQGAQTVDKLMRQLEQGKVATGRNL